MLHKHPLQLISYSVLLLLCAPTFGQDSAATAQKTAGAAQKTATESAQETATAVQNAKSDQETMASQIAAAEAAIKNLQSLIEKQQALLQTQSEQIDQQNKALSDLQNRLNKVDKEQAAAAIPVEQHDKRLQSQSVALSELQTELDRVKQLNSAKVSGPNADEIALKERIASLENTVAEIPQDPATKMGMESFPGSIRIPGTNGAIKFGGFVKVDFVDSFSPLASKDRFVVGSIPVNNSNNLVQKQTSLTANQSRFNIDARENSSLGQFRAFIEGDFGGENNTFRLRHAFGQFRDVLAGQTWSTFYDPEAAPEEVDFEGISGKVVLRQAQVRWFPSIGIDWNLQLALEDPNPEVTDYCNQNNPADDGCLTQNRVLAAGVSNIPDAVFSVRRNFGERYHLRFAGLARQLRATSTYGGNSVTDQTYGWGVTLSGVVQADWWSASDNFKFQVTAGRGIGRYTNDPNTIGGLDAVFDQNQKIYALPLFAGFVAYEHWWSSTMRSTFLGSFVNINTYGFQPDDAYRDTRRLSANYFWSPIPRVDLGAELLWGRRVNKNNERGNASQLQLMSRYRF